MGVERRRRRAVHDNDVCLPAEPVKILGQLTHIAAFAGPERQDVVSGCAAPGR
jgi:hypothetical protein